jgi:hypothetical protein
MFESLKRAIDEIFGSVIRPMKDWILRQSWGVRVIFLIVIGGAAFAWWKPQAVAGASQQASYYWRSWRGEPDRIPLSSNGRRSLVLALNRLAPSVEADLAGEGDDPLTPWSESQSVVALRSVGRVIPDRDAYVAFVNHGRFAPGCFCWTELRNHPRADVVGHVSGWVMVAFAEIGQPLTAADLDYVLSRQHGGWWPMFLESGASRYPSTYATGWMLLGLHEQRTAGLIPSDKRPAVDAAIRRAAGWLMRSRDGARWKAHPGARATDSGEALSGFVLHVLHEVGTKDLSDVDRAWLGTLPDRDLEPSSRDDRYVELPYGRNDSAIDQVSEVRLPWILLATADAYRNGTVGEKARALKWFETILRDPSVRTADTQGLDWVRSELLIGLSETGKLADCKDCENAGTGL